MAEHSGRPLRWDLYEEHLNEGAFRWTQWDQALDAPDFTLEEVAEREEPVAALAALPSAEPPALAALRRAFELSSSAAIPADLPSLLKKEDGLPELFALVLDTLGAHGLATAPLCTPFLTHPEPQVAAAALRAASRARLPLDSAVLQRALDSDAPALRDAALVAGLMGGHRIAWAACQALAEARAPGARLPLLLLGMSGDERDVKRLLELLPDAKLQRDVLWALGFSGRVAAADACVELMRQKPVAALAGEAFSAITGLRLAEQYAAPSSSRRGASSRGRSQLRRRRARCRRLPSVGPSPRASGADAAQSGPHDPDAHPRPRPAQRYLHLSPAARSAAIRMLEG